MLYVARIHLSHRFLYHYCLHINTPPHRHSLTCFTALTINANGCFLEYYSCLMSTLQPSDAYKKLSLHLSFDSKKVITNAHYSLSLPTAHCPSFTATVVAKGMSCSHASHLHIAASCDCLIAQVHRDF